MTDEISTLDVGSPSFGSGATDGSQYLTDPFSGGDDIVLQSITEQINESAVTTTEEEVTDSETTEGLDSPEDVQETTEEETTSEDEVAEEA